MKKAFLELAKKYHPDSQSPEADINKFVAVENAFRILSKHNTGSNNSNEVEKVVYDIKVCIFYYVTEYLIIDNILNLSHV